MVSDQIAGPLRFTGSQFPGEKWDGSLSPLAVLCGPGTPGHWEELRDRAFGLEPSPHHDVSPETPGVSIQGLSFLLEGKREVSAG